MIHLQYCVLCTEVDRKPFSLSFVNFLSSEDKGASISVCSWYLVDVFFASLFWQQLMQTHAVVWSGQTVGTLVTSLKMATVKASIRQHSTCAQYAKTAALTNREASLSSMCTSVSVGQFTLHFNMPHHARWSKCKLYSPFRVNSTAVVFV